MTNNSIKRGSYTATLVKSSSRESDSLESSPSIAPAISLLKGGGALRGVSEQLAASPVTDTGSLSIPSFTSPGRSNFGPQLWPSYNSSIGNETSGLGCDLSLFSIGKTDKGLFKYQDAAEYAVFILFAAEDLVLLFNPDGSRFKDTIVPAHTIYCYRPHIEALLVCIER